MWMASSGQCDLIGQRDRIGRRHRVAELRHCKVKWMKIGFCHDRQRIAVLVSVTAQSLQKARSRRATTKLHVVHCNIRFRKRGDCAT